MTEEPKCDYCEEKAEKKVHSFTDVITDEGGNATDTNCEQHDREYNYAGKNKNMAKL